MAGKDPRINIKIDGDSSGYKRALKQTEKESQSFAKRARKSWTSVGAGVGGFASAAGAALGVVTQVADATMYLVRAAAAEQQQYAKLEGTLQSSLDLTKEQADAYLDLISSWQYGSTFADDQLRPAIASLAAVTKDAATAQVLLRTAMDTSVATGIPLETITKALAKAADGNTTSLGKLFPALSATAIKSGDLSRITDELTMLYGGADAAASKTAEGGLQDLDDAMGDVVETLGNQLLPYLEQFTAWMASPEGQKALADFVTTVEEIATSVGEMADAFSEAYDKLKPLIDGIMWLEDKSLAGRFRDWLTGGSFVPSSASAPTAPASGGSTYAARPQGPTIVVNGALDAPAVARQVQRILAADTARGGTVRTRMLR